jgi:NADH-quinone oxidoreductase subunit N
MQMVNEVNDIIGSLQWIVPEIILVIATLAFLIAGLFKTQNKSLAFFSIAIFFAVALLSASRLFYSSPILFGGMLRTDALSSFIKILINFAAMLTCLLSITGSRNHRSEYFSFLMAIVFGAHLLAMTTNFLMIFISIEIISISSYVLAGFGFDKRGAEGSLKYFLFGSVASAVMLYGFSFLYGMTGSVNFTDDVFFQSLIASQNPLTNFAITAILLGILFKISAAPMHFWAPDVFDAAPVPVVAFFSTVPKLAALTLLLKFFISIKLFGQSQLDWQYYLAVVIILTITVGNFGALKQTNIKRMMAYSSIAQSGFLMIGLIVFLPHGIHFFLFYAAVYVAMNFLVFIYINSFEKAGMVTFADYSGMGKYFVLGHLSLLVGLIALTGLPPTAGFSGKLFLFSSVWSVFQHIGSPIMLALLVFGLLNTVISLFYYLRIPYFAFLKNGKPAITHNILPFENLLGLFLVLILLILFFQPGLLMSWINKINFVL